jgi:hypothetical protein
LEKSFKAFTQKNVGSLQLHEEIFEILVQSPPDIQEIVERNTNICFAAVENVELKQIQGFSYQ